MATEIVLKVAAANGVIGGVALSPFDRDGVMLPNVLSVSTTSEAGERPSVTITFAVDGKAVRFE